MAPITIKNGWKEVVISKCGILDHQVCYVAMTQHGTRRSFKTLAGAKKWAAKMVA